MKKKIIIIACCLIPLLFAGCNKTETEEYSAEQSERIAINLFLRSIFGTYYYWIDSMEGRINQWKNTDDPSEGFSKFKHSDDRWGFVSNMGQAIAESFQGVSTSYGYNGFYGVLNDTVVLVVEYVSADTPASKAGIKRGDIFSQFNGKALIYKEGDDIDELNAKLKEMVYQLNSNTSTFTYAYNGQTIRMTPERIYEDPILVSKVFDIGGKKVAYLHYTQFELNALEKLVDIFSGYKSEGVSELILDLRYNGGGYVDAEYLMASLIAPLANVKNGDLFSKSQYNKKVSEYFPDTEIRFAKTISVQMEDGTEKTFSPVDANPDLNKLYVLMTENTASASELLVNGLLPYMDVDIFGEQSYGKTSSCGLFLGKDWYTECKNLLTAAQYKDGITYASDWCGYVTLAYNVNSLGEAECCPYGFEVDAPKTVQDNPLDGYQLGDPKETMLAKVLGFAGYSAGRQTVHSVSPVNPVANRKITTHKKLMLPEWGFAIER